MSEIDRTLPNTDSGSETSPSREPKEGESSDEYSWDNDPGDLSFVTQNSPLQVDQADRETRDRQTSTADWPVTRPVSEEYPHYIEEKPLASPTTSSEKRRSSTDFDFLDLANFRPVKV